MTDKSKSDDAHNNQNAISYISPRQAVAVGAAPLGWAFVDSSTGRHIGLASTEVNLARLKRDGP